MAPKTGARTWGTGQYTKIIDEIKTKGRIGSLNDYGKYLGRIDAQPVEVRTIAVDLGSPRKPRSVPWSKVCSEAKKIAGDLYASHESNENISIEMCYSPRMILIRFASCVLLTMILGGFAIAQTSRSKAETLVACPPLIQTESSLTPYGFARASLSSLWYARNAVKDATAEIKEAQSEADNPVSFLTAMMRSTKISTNDFICAKRSIERYTSSKSELTSTTPLQRENIRTAAQFETMVYNQHIEINQRLLDLLKKMSSNLNVAELSDQMSTLQVERGQRWSDLLTPTAMALMMLVDMRRTDENGNFLKAADPNPGQTRRLIITKKQKQELLDWMNEHFTEFNDGTTEDNLSDPAKTAKLYITFFDGRKGSDE